NRVTPKWRMCADRARVLTGRRRRSLAPRGGSMDTILLVEDTPIHAERARAWQAPALHRRRWGTLFVLPLLFLVAGSLQAAAPSGPMACADIARYHVAMQMNAHAAA